MASIATDVLIVGGGLSGLRLADLLVASHRDVLLIEARDRLGGRIRTASAAGASFDLGPAWFWPGQPRMAALVQRFGLQVFEQHSTGDARFEDGQGQIQQGKGIGSMQGSFRISGGLGRLIQHLADQVPSDRLRLNMPLSQLDRGPSGIIATTVDGTRIHANVVVLALPARLAAALTCTPALPVEALNTMRATPTWMAGQAKAVLVYNRPFWRDAGLSGDAISHVGPMFEVHDASPADAQCGALFGFIGVPADHRTDTAALKRAVVAQATRLFGPAAPAPLEVLLKDWAQARFTATPDDLAPVRTHPRYGLPRALQGLWDGHLLMGGTEVAAEFGGYLEGALEAAEAACHAVAAAPAQRPAS